MSETSGNVIGTAVDFIFVLAINQYEYEEEVLYSAGGCALEQIAQRGSGVSLSENI